VSENKKSNLENLRKLAKLANVDVDAAFEEIKQEIVERIKPLIPHSAPAGEVDMDVLAQKVSGELRSQQNTYISKAVNEAETRIGLKLGEALEEFQKLLTQVTSKAGGVDSNTIIQGVVGILQPEIVKASQAAAESVFQANSKAMVDAINSQLNTRLQEMQSQTAATSKTATMPQGFNPLAMLFNPEILTQIKEIVSLVRGNATLADPQKKIDEFYNFKRKLDGMHLNPEQEAEVVKFASGKENIINPQSSSTQT
jgi:hypothetical protein